MNMAGRLMIMLAAASALGGVLSCERAAVPGEDPVKAALVIESTVIAPGETFHAGVHFAIPAGWHVYWKEPGAIGLPTEVSFSAPAGFRVGPLQWPAHKEFTQGPGLQGLGYEEAVLLFVEIQAPKDLRPGKSAVIGAKAKWLSCGPDICIPDEKEFSVGLTIGEKGSREHHQLFAGWKRRL